MLQIAPGLRRWTARHDHWEEDVGSLAVETSDGLVLIDPIDPPRDVARADHVLVTVYWHARSAGEIGAKHVWAPARSNRPLKTRGVEMTDVFHGGEDLPGGIRAFQTARAAEVVSGCRTSAQSLWATCSSAPARSRVRLPICCDSALNAGWGREHTTSCAGSCVRSSTCRSNGCSSRTVFQSSAPARMRSPTS